MKRYQKLFGGAPAAWALSLTTLWIAFRLQSHLPLPPIHRDPRSGILVLAAFGAVALVLSIWTHVSLPPWLRGKRLVTTGAFRYLRHPLYASFLLFFFGLAYWLNDWVFVVWAVAQLPIWNSIAAYEERLMRGAYPAYAEYCLRTRRFIPGVW